MTAWFGAALARYRARKAAERRWDRELLMAYSAALLRREEERRRWYYGVGPAPIGPRLPEEVR